MTQPITPVDTELTRSESVLAQQMFQQAFPELVRRLPPEALEKAAAKTAAALVAGITALRKAGPERHEPSAAEQYRQVDRAFFSLPSDPSATRSAAPAAGWSRLRARLARLAASF